MACSGSYNGYHSYGCYKELKYQFVERVENIIYITDRVKTFENEYSSIKRQNLDRLPKVYTKLKKYLSNDAVFAATGTYNGDATCNYINYLLYDGIRNENHGHCDEQTFNNFRDFVYDYNKSTRSRICINNLKHLDFEVFRKWEALYNLYDTYSNIPPANTNTYKEYCSRMHNLAYLYNQFLKAYPSDSSAFDDALTKFEKLMNTITKDAERNCFKEKFPINKPRLFVPTVVQMPPPANPSSASESNLPQGGPLDSAVKTKPPELTSSSTMSVDKQKIAYPENSQRSDVSEPPKVVEASVSQETLERRPPHQNMEHSEQHVLFTPHESYEPRRTYRPGDYYGQVGHIDTNEILSSEENSLLVTKQLGLGSEKEHGGVMIDMKNAFSGFMNSVDPVPVVGVSGGMGALFLLFRLEHSLEEEEDAHVEFLVVSVDISQEDFPDMKSFMMEVLDPVQ
ncbi:Plasmodium vivax Vir protein, putative [Plasmodium vivax]|uniref:Vir protein, putative n=1 Tax=Plasmodium vivax TaxID=5855 RepID=A0A1G4E347_PLAVI|nr:Plasmodium vivax Vir protein, putative [Plasmodium vivax]